jgi:phage terminase large subunit-like protein
LAFHQSLAKGRAIFGGNRSGKTEAGAAEFALWITGSQRYRPRKRVKAGTGWICTESTEIQREIVQPKILKWLPKSKIKKITYIQRGIIDFIELIDGWHINFKNYEQGADKYQGKDVDIAWCDEEPPKDIWTEIQMRLIDRGGVTLLTMTPVNGMTWVYQEIWEKNKTNNIECFLMDMDSNPYLPQEEKDRVLAGLTDQEKQIRKEGKFIALHGLIYPQFSESKHVIPSFDIPTDWRRVVSVDPHLAKPTSVLWGAMAQSDYGRVSKGDWVIYRELRTKGIIPDVVANIMVYNGRDRIFARIGDPSLNMKDNITGVNPFDEFAEQGFPLIAANKAVESGIYEIRKLLDQTPVGLWVFDNCIGLIKELRHYSFSELNTDARKSYSEKILKREDDFCDCLRYLVNTGIRPATVGMRPQDAYIISDTGRIVGVRDGRR